MDNFMKDETICAINSILAWPPKWKLYTNVLLDELHKIRRDLDLEPSDEGDNETINAYIESYMSSVMRTMHTIDDFVSLLRYYANDWNTCKLALIRHIVNNVDLTY